MDIETEKISVSVTVTEEVKCEEVKSEKIERQEKQKKSYCPVMKNDVHTCLKCFTYSWAFCLNGIECCCGLTANTFMCLGKSAIGCREFLEMIDCDKH